MNAGGVDGELVDHSVNGLLSIRMVSPPPDMKEKLRRRLGPSTETTDGEPDICITFVDSLPIRGRLRFLGLNRAAYDDDCFYLLDDLGHKMRIDLGTVGERCEILCERNASPLPYLLPMMGLRLLRKGHVLLHSSSFVHQGKGVLVAGWQKGGKTEMLLSFMAEGASFMGNEWTIVSPAKGMMRGVGGALQIWDWHLRHVPQYVTRLPDADRRRMAVFRSYQSLYRALPKRSPRRGAIAKVLHRLSLEGGVPLLGQVSVAPERIFGDSVRWGAVGLDRVFLATVGTGETRVFPSEPREVARRMSAAQEYERRDLIAAYYHFRFAFPDRRNELLENAVEQEIGLLSEAFSNTSAYEITHPYPVPLADLYRAAAPFCV